MSRERIDDETETADRSRWLERLAQLESELLQLRRALAADPEALPGDDFTVLHVTVGSRHCGVAVDSIVEVVPMLAAERLPEAPPWVLGTFRYDEDVVPLVDLRRRLGGEPTRPHPDQFVVIAETGASGDGARRTGFAVDRLGELLPVTPDDVAPPRAGLPQAPFLLGQVQADDVEISLLSLRRLASDLPDAATEATSERETDP